jgi:acyl-CoA synthetase (AMP-forming)/AMP-acid ligase II
VNIARLLERSARVHTTRPALAFGTEVVADYAQFFERSARLARALQDHMGIAPGDRIGLFSANHPAYLEAMYAAWIAGAAVVPMNAKLHAREAEWILRDSGARACWTDRVGAQALRESATVEARLLDLDDTAGLRAVEFLPLATRAAGDLAWLFYTSGTTGRPKGVMLSHGNLLHATQCFLADVHGVAVGEALVHAAPQSHGSGLYNFAYVAEGGLNVVPDSRAFDESEVLDLTARYPGMCMFAAPTMVKRLVAAERARPGRAQGLGTIIYGGGPMYVADIQDAIAAMGQKFAQIYGQGESPMTITVLPRHVIAEQEHPRYLERLASVGHVQLCMELSIRDAAGRELACGEVGEVCARGPAVMQGYWNNPAATQEAIRDGWLYTGDVGVLDADGFLTLKDRSKDLIISGGTNIYPREVEEVLLTHPAVQEVSVIGVPDDEWGESVLAFVVAEGVDAAELDAYCLQHIARFKRPRHYRFVRHLPKSNYGKVLKTELRLIAQSAG